MDMIPICRHGYAVVSVLLPRMALEVCPHCDRLYSTHSLSLHVPRCFDNPKNKTPPKEKKKSSRDERRDRPRPLTRSLSRNSNAAHRICFVCGNGYPEEDLQDHEENCFRVWQQTAEHLTPTFIVREPQRVWHPSVDGTRDVTRQNSVAREQARTAQRVKCRNCAAPVPFWQAVDHSCTPSQPEVQFFIPQRA